MPGIPADLMWTTAVTTITGLVVTAMYRKLGAYTADSAKWRKDVDEKIDNLTSAQASTMRSDLIHKAHRYIEDVGAASIEEKQSWHEEWEQYQLICPENHFIDDMARRVMALPERKD